MRCLLPEQRSIKRNVLINTVLTVVLKWRITKMNNLRIFENEQFGTIRTIMINDEPWFVGKDVADVLGYSNSRDALAKKVSEEDKGVANCDTLGGTQDVTIINESGLYSLIFSSKLPKAKEFKHWVTSEVLPAIRKTGYYALSGYNSRVTGVGEIVNLLKLSKDVMRNQGCNNVDIALMMKDVCGQFGIKMPECFIKEQTFEETYDYNGFILSRTVTRRPTL